MPGPRLSSRNGWENVAPHVFLTQRRVEGFRGGWGGFLRSQKTRSPGWRRMRPCGLPAEGSVASGKDPVTVTATPHPLQTEKTVLFCRDLAGAMGLHQPRALLSAPPFHGVGISPPHSPDSPPALPKHEKKEPRSSMDPPRQADTSSQHTLVTKKNPFKTRRGSAGNTNRRCPCPPPPSHGQSSTWGRF